MLHKQTETIILIAYVPLYPIMKHLMQKLMLFDKVVKQLTFNAPHIAVLSVNVYLICIHSMQEPMLHLIQQQNYQR